MEEPLTLLYRDEAVTVCLKPVGVESEEGAGGMVDRLRKQCAVPGKGAEFFAVHRLDRDVAGVMVYANTHAAAASLSEQIRDGRFCKRYLAVTRGIPEPAEFRWEDLLIFDRTRSKAFVVKRERKGVRAASLRGRVLAAREENALLLLRLETGRRHQIRVQAASRQCPLLGDRRYGGPAAPAIALFSCQLEFGHPVTGERLSFFKAPGAGAFADFSDTLCTLTEETVRG